MGDDTAQKVQQICDNTGMTSQIFSKYRERLINKGIIKPAGHGYVEITLPRFSRICRYYS